MSQRTSMRNPREVYYLMENHKPASTLLFTLHILQFFDILLQELSQISMCSGSVCIQNTIAVLLLPCIYRYKYFISFSVSTYQNESCYHQYHKHRCICNTEQPTYYTLYCYASTILLTDSTVSKWIELFCSKRVKLGFQEGKPPCLTIINY